MSDPALNLPLRSTFDATGTDSALRALRQLQQEQAKAQTRGGGDQGASFRAAGQAAQQAEKDTLRYAQALASAQRAQGDLSGAVDTHRAALGKMTPGTIEAHQATTRLAQAQTALQKELAGGASFAQQFGASVSSSLTSIIGPAAAAAAAIAAISKTGELVQVGAQAQQVEKRFDSLAQSAGTTGDALMQALRSASGGEISDLNLQLAANRAQLLGVAHNAEEFSTIMAIARDRAQQMGTTTTDAFNDIVTGLGRGSKLILDNLGILVNTEAANEAYAASIGKTAAALSDEEKKQALINQVLKDGQATIAATGGAVESNASKIARLGATFDNLKTSIGAGLADTIGPVADNLATIADAMERINGPADEATARVDALRTQLGESVGIFGSYQIGLQGIAQLLNQVAPASTAVTQATNQQTAATQQGTAAALDSTAVQLAQADSMALAGVQAQAAALAAEQKSAADQVAAVDAQTHALALQALDEQARAAAAGLAASGSAGASTAAILANSSSLVDVLTAAYYRLAAAQAAAGAAAAAKAGIATRSAADETKNEGISARNQANRAAASKRYNDMLDAQRDRINATGTAQQRVGQAESDLAAARQRYGATSAEAYRAETRLLQLRQQAARAGGGGGRGGRAGGGGGGGGGARVTEAERGAERLEDIERSSGRKLEEINEQTQEKLLAIEQKYAARRAAAARDLADEIARTNAQTGYEQELNDFDQFQKDLSDDQKAALKAREAAEVNYNAKVAAAQEEARQTAAGGDAEYAEDVLKAKTEQAKKEKEIEERSAEAKRNVGKKGAAAVDAEAAQARAKAQQEADTAIAIAKAKAAERAGAEQAEKDEVLAQAEEQKQKVISAAEESASKVKGASDGQKATVIANLRAQAAAIKTWADTVVEQAGRAQTAMGGVSGPPAAGEGAGTGEGGGTPAPGPGNSTAGGSRDIRAGGRSRGASGGGGSVQDAIDTLNDAAEIIKVIKPFVASNKGAVKLLNEYALTVKSAVSVLTQISDLRQRLVAPAPVINLQQIQALANEVVAVLQVVLSTINPAVNAKVRVLAKYFETEKAAVDILNSVIELRKALSAPTPVISTAYVNQLIAESNAVVGLILANLIPLKQREVDGLKTYADAAGAAIGILSDVAGLRKDLSEQAGVGPFNMGLIQGLVRRAAEITRLVQSQLVPLTKSQAEGFQSYADAVGATMSLLKDTADLRKELSDQKDVSPFNMALIKGLAMRANQITRIVLAQVVPLTEAQAEALQRYSDTAGSAVSILKDTADLRKQLSEGTGSAFDMRVIQRLADDARRITEIVVARMVPASEETAAAAQRFADTTGSAVATIKDVLELPAKLFTDYTSPSDAQIGMVVKDTNRIIAGVTKAAALYDTKGLEAAKLFGEASGSVLAAFKDQLLFAQALSSGDFEVDKAKLAIFERGMAQTIGVADRLGAQAAKIPPANIAALQAVTAANTASYESMIKLAAVPFGNLGNAAGAYAGRGTTTNYFTNTFVLPAGTTQQMAKEIIGIMQQQVSTRR